MKARVCAGGRGGSWLWERESRALGGRATRKAGAGRGGLKDRLEGQPGKEGTGQGCAGDDALVWPDERETSGKSGAATQVRTSRG